MTFKDIYKAPFHTVYDGLYGVSSNGVKTFTGFSLEAQTHIDRIVKILNGEDAPKYKKADIAVQGAKLCVCGHIIIVRGWGMLIGTGGFNLSREDAAKIQDDFINWVLDSITE